MNTPPEWMVLPFCALLLCIAVLPLLAGHFWEHHYKKVSLGLGLLASVLYLSGGFGLEPVLHSMEEYISFMGLVGSLFVISGGISIKVKGESIPWKNVVFLLTGAVTANVIGTTGASMLLIRPWIRMNKHRITKYHVVFFIFIVSNVGGCLTPIGDPPLFLGFLRGIGFWWMLGHAWPAWLAAVGLLLAVFYVIDVRNFHRVPARVQHEMEEHQEHWFLRGRRNLLWLGVVLGAMLMPHEWRMGTPAFGIPVAALVMAAAAWVSFRTTPAFVHEANDFSCGPVKEVAWLFAGIFLTMRPALDILQGGQVLTISSPLHYYFGSGALSAFLDNAPTYLAFLTAAMGRFHLSVDDPAHVIAFATQQAPHVVAVSLGSVFFGAGSYIGNGPNFMVKAIAHKAHVRTPSFPGYIVKYSLPMLVPVLAVVGWLVLRT